MKNIATLTILLIALTGCATPNSQSSQTAATKADAQKAAGRGDYATALKILEPIAAAGDADSLANIGNMYGFGWGVPKNLETAASYWLLAAEKHVPTAFGNIATLYKTGTGGMPKDDAIAASWYIRAAEHRHIPSMITLSDLYSNGDGVETDHIRALAWASLAANNTSSPSLQSLARTRLLAIAKDMPKEDITRSQELTFELVKKIDANLKLYVEAASS